MEEPTTAECLNYERRLDEPWVQDFLVECSCGEVARVLFRPVSRDFRLAPEADAAGWRYEFEFGYYCGRWECHQAALPPLGQTEEQLVEQLVSGVLKG